MCGGGEEDFNDITLRDKHVRRRQRLQVTTYEHSQHAVVLYRSVER